MAKLKQEDAGVGSTEQGDPLFSATASETLGLSTEGASPGGFYGGGDGGGTTADYDKVRDAINPESTVPVDIIPPIVTMPPPAVFIMPPVEEVQNTTAQEANDTAIEILQARKREIIEARIAAMEQPIFIVPQILLESVPVTPPVIAQIIPPSKVILDRAMVEERIALKQKQEVIDVQENAAPSQLPGSISFKYVVTVTVSALPHPTAREITFNINVLPAIPVFGIGTVTETSTIKLNEIPLALESSMTEEIDRLLSGKVESFYDNDRKLKTLLNFGTDYQPLLTNWKLDESDSTGQGMVLKLYNPLPPEVTLKTPVFISRELSYPVLEKLFIIASPTPPPTVYLRYPNKRLNVAGRSGGVVNDVTLNTLLSSGAFDIVKPQDRVTDEWFTTALEGAELNVDYSNFRNFVFYGSAEKRLEAFQNKLLLVENYDAAIAHNSASMAVFGSVNFTSSLAYASLYNMGQERQDIIRSFDGYERFLYYGSGSEMSGSFTREEDRDYQDPFYYLPDATWPKISGVVAPVASASLWYDSIQEITQIYDKWNVNRFVNNLPLYIQEDTQSEEFLRFFDLVGHMFDTVKLYIDQMSDIYDRNSNTDVGLSSDLVWDIANAFGVNLPNQYAIESILDYTLGATNSSKVYKQVATETWRRFLHNQIFLMKSKGTKTALRALLNVYGVLPTTIQIRESSTPSYFYASQSYEIYEEQTNALVFDDDADSYLTVPWPSGTLAIQTRFSTGISGQTQVLINADNAWAVMLYPGTGSNYQLRLRKGATVTATSSYWPIGNEEYYNLMVTYSGSKVQMYLNGADDDGDIDTDDYVAETTLTGVGSLWTGSSNFYVGGWSGSIYGNGFVGNIDEVRMWNELPTEDVYTNWVKYPGLYNGNTSTSAKNNLLVRLSFNTPLNLGTASLAARFVSNESPHQRLSTAPVNLTHFSASGFNNVTTYPYSYTTYTRTVQRFTPTGGGTQFDTNKIIVDASPTSSLQYISGSTIPVLHRDSSIIPLSDKDDNTKATNVVGFYFSPTAAINDSIIRSIGNIDLNDYIADPRYITAERYSDLDALNEFYWTYYAYPINTNSFIDFVKNLLSPMFEQARQLVPARAKLLTGIVIEPHILERNKIAWKPIQREESDLDVTNNLSSQPIVQGASGDLDAVYDASNFSELSSGILDKDTTLDASPLDSIRGEISDKNTNISLNFGTINTGYTNYFDTINLYQDLYTQLNSSVLDYQAIYDINAERHNAYAATSASYSNPYMPTYGSAANLESDIGARTYFDNINGFVGLKAYSRIRTKQNILTDKGSWVGGQTYRRNDYVLQPTTVTDSACIDGNGREFYAIMDNFISNIPPYGDVAHWRPVAYITVEIMDVKKAVLINGVLSLVPTGSGYSVVTGYLPQHYRYYQPNYTAFTRARYTGCSQGDTTTPDGKAAVEILMSAADTLVVATNEPVQTNDNLGGPTYLDVK